MKVFKYKILQVFFLVICLQLDSCKHNNLDQPVIPSGQKLKVYKGANIINKDTDLGISLVDSANKEVVLFYGSKNDNGNIRTIKQVKAFSAISNIGTIINFSVTNSLVSDFMLFSASTSISVKFTQIDIPGLKVSYTVTNNKTGNVILDKKDAIIPQEVANKLIASQVILVNIKNARIAYSACQFAAQAVAALQNTSCILALVEFSAITVETGGLDLLLGGIAVLIPCWDAVNDPLFSEECPTVEPKDLPGLALDCLSLFLGEISPGCINTLLQYYTKLVSNLFNNDANKQNSNPSNSGGGYGDPHLRTFDGLYYDFQGYGEFIAIKSLTDNFEIQVRQEQIAPYLNRQVTMHTGIAINTGNDKVCVYPDKIYINNRQYGFGSNIVSLTKGTVSYSNGVVTIVSDNEDVVKVNIQSLSPAFLDYRVTLNNNRKGKVQGLLGNFDGISSNDTQIQSGSIISPYTFNEIYPAFTDSWRVSQEKSLFVYLNGATTITYTKKDFPKSQTELDATARIQAEAICQRQGITEEPFLSACVMDVAFSGSDKYTISALAAEESKMLINNFSINKFTSFSADDLNAHGNAEISDGIMYLTRASSNQSGAVYKKYKVDISNGFETIFDFSMTQPGGIQDAKQRIGADGLVFVIQDYGSKIIPPSTGGGLGYDGLPRSLAVEFDTFDDKYYGIVEGPNDIWLNTQGISANSTDDSKTLIKPQTLPLPSVMNDGKIHHVVIRYSKKSQGIYKLEMFYDNGQSPYLIADNINIQNIIGAYSSGVYVGFSASTGSGWENHIIRNWTYKSLQ